MFALALMHRESCCRRRITPQRNSSRGRAPTAGVARRCSDQYLISDTVCSCSALSHFPDDLFEARSLNTKQTFFFACSALQSNHRLLSILSDLVKTCVSCEQDIVRVLQDAGALSLDCNHTIPLIDEEEPLPSLGSTLNGKLLRALL